MAGCARLYGWDIHAPGVLSGGFVSEIQPVKQRVALYLPPALLSYTSKDKGGRSTDPQTYYVGESLGPMLVEAFQDAWDEFVFMEVEPTPGILRQYGIPYLVAVSVKGFDNRVSVRGRQVLELTLETAVFDADMNLIKRFDARGASDAQKVFAKKGGLEVNLNAAIEQAILAAICHLHDVIPGGGGAK